MKFTTSTSISFLALVLCSQAAFAQNLDPVNKRLAPGFATIRESTLRADLTFLSSDALQGRMSLQPGDDAAIQWIAAEFAKPGLQPPADGSYLQPVDLVEYRGDRTQSFVGLR